MEFLSLLQRKQRRGRLTPEEIEWLIRAYTSGEIPDYQMSAWLMAVYLRGLSKGEALALTRAMMGSGQVLDLSSISGPKVDKHSTGGVGDKVSLVLAPLVASCGVVVPMVSGRSLGHTGGTLDKLESIPGFRTGLTVREFYDVLERVGVVMAGQTDELCPADKKLYALRNATGTVDSIPLIAASIMAKKLAEGIDGLVLDVKTGAGAFMSRLRAARQLARLMVDIGSAMGKKARALITSMSQPLGRAVGNSLEVKEAIAALNGNGPADLMEVTLALGEEMLLMAGVAKKRQQATRLLLRALATGRALKRFQALIKAQGGNPAVVDDPGLLPLARYQKEAFSEAAGYIRSIDTLKVGLLGLEIGLGRRKLDDGIDPGAGVVFRKKVCDRVNKGEVLAEVYAGAE
ncbi:MAG: thymidine phosphorylase, partial [bacterium]